VSAASTPMMAAPVRKGPAGSSSAEVTGGSNRGGTAVGTGVGTGVGSGPMLVAAAT
jgi:hypothetical protein